MSRYICKKVFKYDTVKTHCFLFCLFIGIPVIPSAIYSGLRSTNPVIDKKQVFYF